MNRPSSASQALPHFPFGLLVFCHPAVRSARIKPMRA